MVSDNKLLSFEAFPPIAVLVAHLCLTFRDPMDSVHGIL